MADTPKVYAEHTWESFVRPAVRFKANEPDGRTLAKRLMPYYPKSCVIIASYLDDADQFWKINYHWELLKKQVGKAMKLELASDSIGSLTKIEAHLVANPPDPPEGYVASKKVGLPYDRSGHEKIMMRWTTMRGDKATFRRILDKELIPKKHPPAEGWDLAAAPVARPGTSKHGCGYAFDIHGAGQNQLIKKISSEIGATLTFDEKSHVHVEFKQGVLVGIRHAADDARDGRWSGWKHLA